MGTYSLDRKHYLGSLKHKWEGERESNNPFCSVYSLVRAEEELDHVDVP